MSRKYIQHLRSNTVETIQQYGLDKDIPKVPEADNLREGEIAINFAEDQEVISIKNDDNQIVKFLNEKVIYENEEITAAAMSQLKDETNQQINEIYNAIENIQPGGDIVQSDWNESDEESMAFIKNKPTIPTKVSDLTNDSGFITLSDVPQTDLSNYYTKAESNERFLTEETQSDWTERNDDSPAYILHKPTKLSDFTNDSGFITLSDVPASATPNDGVLTIQKNGTSLGTFSANQQEDATINVTVPTKTSDLNNDSGFVTAGEIEGGVQSDWNETSSASLAFIKNKPIFILHMTIEPSELDKTVSISETYEELAMAIKNGKTILLWGAAMQGEYLYTIDSDNGGRVVSDSIDPRTGNYIFYFARVTDSGNIVIYGFGKGINNTLTLKVFNSLDEVLCVTITSQQSVQSNEVLTNISCDIPCRLIYQSYRDGVNIIAKNTINDAYGLNGVDSARVYRLVKATPFIAADGNTLGNDGTLQFVSYEVGDNFITTYTYNATFDATSDEWKYRSDKLYIPLYVKLTSKVTALATNDYFNITSDTDYSTIVNAYLNNRVVVLRNCVVEEGQSTLRPDDTGHVYYLRRKHGTSKLQFIAIEDVQATLDHSLKLFIFEVDSDNVWKYRREEIPYIYNANWIEYGMYDHNNPTYRKIERYDELLEAINNGQMIKLQNYLATAIDTSLVEDENKIILKFGSSDFKPNGTVTTVSITKYDNYCVVAFEYLGSHYDASWILNKDRWTNEELIEKYVLLGDAVDYKETIFITPSHDECLYATRAYHDNIHNQLEVTFFKTDPSIITYQVTLTGGNVEIDSEEFLLATEPQP